MFVFISYSHVDRQLAKKVAARINKASVDYFLDEKSIVYGGDINATIRESMRSITHLIMIASPASLKSQWAPYEVGLADSNGAIIIPYISHPSLDLPGFLSQRKGFTKLAQITSFFESEKEFVSVGGRPQVSVPDHVASLWTKILDVNFADSVESREEVWKYFDDWRQVMKTVDFAIHSFDAEDAFYRGTEHYLMGFLSAVIDYLDGKLPRAEIERRRKRTVEVICIGKYPELESI